MIENTLWVERFRPNTLDGYIGNEHLKTKVQKWIDAEDIPHLLFYGIQGTGKTTLAKIITKEVDCDVLYINASDENNVDTVRQKLKTFSSSMGFSKWKIVILDESDYLTLNAQAALRNLMETFSKSTRFILTCNYIDKIIPAIRSRCQEFEIYPPSKKDVAIRLVSIMNELGVEYSKKDLAKLVNQAYPDIRKVINSIQSSVIDNKLEITESEQVRLSYMDDILHKLKTENDPKLLFKDIRQIIADSKMRDFTGLYKFLYDNLEEYATGNIANVIIILAEYQYQDSFAVDKEIHISAMLIKLINTIKG